MPRSVWERLLFSRDHNQSMDILEAQEDLSRIQADAVQTAEAERQRYDELVERHEKLKQAHLRLRKRVDRIELVAEALFVHLQRSEKLDAGAFDELMQELDAADGKLDGRVQKPST